MSFLLHSKGWNKWGATDFFKLLKGGHGVVKVGILAVKTVILEVLCYGPPLINSIFSAGECILELSGHSEVCTALSFLISPTEQNLITASADSCVFVWKLHRCAKFEQVINYQLRLDPHPENGDEIDPSQVCDLNRTEYFGGAELDHSLSMMKTRDDDFRKSPDRGNDSTGNELSDTAASDEETSGTGRNLLDMDMSLPTWLTGEKDKVIKKQVPGGKWANRLQVCESWSQVVVDSTSLLTYCITDFLWISFWWSHH